jgi:ABC-type lipoprotein export system ATPase subunit/GNAT superfamily N-acetyltransferase
MTEICSSLDNKIVQQGDDAYQAEGLRVVGVSVKGTIKRVAVESWNGKKASVELHRFAMVGERDRLIIGGGLERRVWVVGEDNGRIPVAPHFALQATHIFAGAQVDAKVIEVSTAQDLHDYSTLESFHYRGLDLSGDVEDLGSKRKGTGGRRAVLLLQLKLAGRWVSAGYIELLMPLMMAKPRHRAFARPFQHPTLDVSWTFWAKGGQSLVNRIARIARVVVNPELRGANLSAMLVNAAVKFARERWHIAGKRVLFLEISAEMLRHIDFVSGAGFHYLGDTEGNRSRLAKDLVSINKGAKGSSGIMSLQRRYHASFEDYRGSTGDSFEALRSRIDEVLRHDDPWKVMTVDEWLALRPVIRSPIPYYMLGLDEASNTYVKEGALPTPVKRPSDRPPALDGLKIEGLDLHSNYDLPLTDHSRLVMDSFGITTKTIRTRLAGPVNLTAQAGTITFVAGSSGCGKSLLLACLDPQWRSDTVEMHGSIAPADYSASWLTPFPPQATLFEFLAGKHGADRAFDALARVGLSEALAFLKPFELLSRGQRYRAMLADLTLGDAQIWLIDEFCSDLDPLTARIVAHKLRETVRREARIAFVAAANHSHFIAALRPHRIVVLRTGGGCAVLSGKEYTDGVLEQAI